MYIICISGIGHMVGALENGKKILEKSGKSQGILSSRKSGNPACVLLYVTLYSLKNVNVYYLPMKF